MAAIVFRSVPTWPGTSRTGLVAATPASGGGGGASTGGVRRRSDPSAATRSAVRAVWYVGGKGGTVGPEATASAPRVSATGVRAGRRPSQRSAVAGQFGSG